MIQDLHKAYFTQYLMEIREVGETTVGKYQNALNTISKRLVRSGLLKESIYEVSDLADLERIKNYLVNDPDFCDLDERGHRMYSAAFNNYCRFAQGCDFSNNHKQITEMDIKVPRKDSHIREAVLWERSNIVKSQALEFAEYKCELNPDHITFTAESTGQPYMEGHHAIPMKVQDDFDNSLDVYANIVCLCPICHRLLHYGITYQKKDAVDKIYYDRSDRLAASGIKVSQSEFEQFAM